MSLVLSNYTVFTQLVLSQKRGKGNSFIHFVKFCRWHIPAEHQTGAAISKRQTSSVTFTVTDRAWFVIVWLHRPSLRSSYNASVSHLWSEITSDLDLCELLGNLSTSSLKESCQSAIFLILDCNALVCKLKYPLAWQSKLHLNCKYIAWNIFLHQVRGRNWLAKSPSNEGHCKCKNLYKVFRKEGNKRFLEMHCIRCM